MIGMGLMTANVCFVIKKMMEHRKLIRNTVYILLEFLIYGGLRASRFEGFDALV